MVHRKNAPDSPGWTLRVFSNKYLALTGEGGIEQETEVLYDKINGIGTHEVVIESLDQNTELELLPQRLIKVAAMGNEKKSDLPSGFQKFLCVQER